MSSAAPGPIASTYACKCLNVRLRSTPAQSAPPEAPHDPAYSPVFVLDDGITVTHPQLTVRIRTRGIPIPGTLRCSRFTSLSCLLCELPVYRVFQIVPVDVEGKDGPLLPTEDWVEHEILKSSTGWVEVHKDCPTGDALVQAESSPDYSQVFSLMLPSSPLPLASSKPAEEPPSSPTSSSSAVSASPPPTSYLTDMRPLFPPPPFTPSHSAFMHLSSLAGAQSQALRAQAEQYIADVVRDKKAEVERAEAELRRSVEVLWKKFREAMNKINHERSHSAAVPRSPLAREPKMSVNTSSVSVSGTSPHGTPTPIRDFVPIQVPVARSPPAPTSRMSALSASLVTSSFHHPRARQSPPPGVNASPRSSNQSISTADSATLVQPNSAGVLGSNVLQYKRNINDSINTATSYRYFQDLEEDMARHKREREALTKKPESDQAQTQEAGPSRRPTTPPTNGNKKQKKQQSGSESNTEDMNVKAETDPMQSRGRESKGKRKVTFDSQPAIVTIKREVNSEKEEAAAAQSDDPREMIFDLEDLDDEGIEHPPGSRHSLPLIEQPPVSRPLRSARGKTQNLLGLPASFSGLRPASLPAPSNMRPLRSQPGVDSSSQMSLPRPSAPISREMPRRGSSSNTPVQSPPAEDKQLDARDAEIMKLVAANAPSHRGAWKPDSKAWQTFTRRQDSKEPSRTNIPEEEDDSNSDGLGFASTSARHTEDPTEEERDDDDDEYEETDAVPYHLRSGIAGSLPIEIHIRSQAKEVLSLASYQPKTSLTDRPGTVVPSLPKITSSTAIRKAAYAERDRSRSMDPGALDFEEDEDDVEQDSDEELSKGETLESGGKGRKKALRILQKRSEIPAAGMWRSLAS
ncbi:hypothetical protein BDQ12DRAFT_675634 [Crucibulum laeve]|uniref:Uncharacterized protein n=1 Tax=Crucibulum laeve TaxID=68775 RepID=A0A5C3MEJ7_9AGAR|nr:hypothetical protein BDQ12DRAFT_675634 [Crucibulum laeve]